VEYLPEVYHILRLDWIDSGDVIFDDLVYYRDDLLVRLERRSLYKRIIPMMEILVEILEYRYT
jgi:hypothetical protein